MPLLPPVMRVMVGAAVIRGAFRAGGSSSVGVGERASHGRIVLPDERSAPRPGRKNGGMPIEPDALAGLLRAWRSRLVPADVGMESYGRRRTPGLRREELAQLAGVSV